MTKTTKLGNDLSIEEILASIREVISVGSSKDKGLEATKQASEEMEEDILELTEPCQDELISDEVASETSRIMRDFVEQISTINNETLNARPGKTTEELVIEMIKPELSKWLNVNLPIITRQLVEQEIKRLMLNK